MVTISLSWVGRGGGGRRMIIYDIGKGGGIKDNVIYAQSLSFKKSVKGFSMKSKIFKMLCNCEFLFKTKYDFQIVVLDL